MREILRVHNQWRAKIANGQVTRGRPGPQPPAADMEQMVILFSIQYTTLLKILLHHFSDVNVVLSFISFHHSHVSFGLQQNNIHYTLANYSSNVMHFICYSFIFYFTYFPTELRNAASDVASSSCLHNIKIQQKHFTDLIIIVYKTCMPQHTKNVTRKFLYVVQIVSKYVSLLLIYF